MKAFVLQISLLVCVILPGAWAKSTELNICQKLLSQSHIILQVPTFKTHSELLELLSTAPKGWMFSQNKDQFQKAAGEGLVRRYAITRGHTDFTLNSPTTQEEFDTAKKQKAEAEQMPIPQWLFDEISEYVNWITQAMASEYAIELEDVQIRTLDQSQKVNHSFSSDFHQDGLDFTITLTLLGPGTLYKIAGNNHQTPVGNALVFLGKNGADKLGTNALVHAADEQTKSDRLALILRYKLK